MRAEFLTNGIDAAVSFLEQRIERTRACFHVCWKRLDKTQDNNEIDSLVRALRGEFIEPGPGADIIQNPDILPTGRNTHAINPYACHPPSLCAQRDRRKQLA
jgi:cobalamin biosynthesis Mg chelatase CobN